MKYSLGFFLLAVSIKRGEKSKEGKIMNINMQRGAAKMEQVCNICRYSEEENVNKPVTTVLLICEDCLKSDMLPPFWDKIFLD
jgi:hypothetical protein